MTSGTSRLKAPAKDKARSPGCSRRSIFHRLSSSPSLQDLSAFLSPLSLVSPVGPLLAFLSALLTSKALDVRAKLLLFSRAIHHQHENAYIILFTHEETAGLCHRPQITTTEKGSMMKEETAPTVPF